MQSSTTILRLVRRGPTKPTLAGVNLLARGQDVVPAGEAFGQIDVSNGAILNECDSWRCDLPFREALFWLSLTMLGTGPFFIADHWRWAIVMIGIGTAGVFYSVDRPPALPIAPIITPPFLPKPTPLWAVMMMLTWIALGYGIFRQFEASRREPSKPSVSSDAKQPSVSKADLDVLNDKLRTANNEISSLQRQRDSAQRKGDTAEQQLADLQRQLAVIPQSPQYPREIGPVSVMNAVSAAGALWKELSATGTAVLLTSGRDNDQLRDNLYSILATGVRMYNTGPLGKMLRPPNYDVDIDAPRLPESEYSGIIVHSPTEYQAIQNVFSCFIIRKASKNVEGLTNFYKVPSILWIEIGKGSPWRPPLRGERWTCAE
jgi:hypothetical protein